MGQKISPLALRLGINQNWQSRWVAKKSDIAIWIKEDAVIRQTIKKKLPNSFISKIEIERQNNKFHIFISTSRLGLILGQKSQNIKRIILILKKALKAREVKIPGLNAQLVANDLAYGIANRESYRKLQRQGVKSAMRLGAKGIKITVSGRLNGANISRKEHISEGKIPLSTLRADIDYGFAESLTNYGQIGIKVWIYQGNIFKKKEENINLENSEK